MPPARVIEFAVLVTVPPHCGLAGALATVTPTGKSIAQPHAIELEVASVLDRDGQGG